VVHSRRFELCKETIKTSGGWPKRTRWRDHDVEDVPSRGHKCPWYRPNETVKSLLDRVLVFAEWFSKWSRSTQFILDRNYIDQCLILLKSTIAE